MNEFIPHVMDVLTESGWINLSYYNPESRILVMNKEFKMGYLRPKVYSDYKYKGPLMEIITDSCTLYCKPNVSLLTNDSPCKAKDLRRGNLLNRFNMWSRIERVTMGEWEGNMTALFFGESVYIPVKYDSNYCLLIS
jgi:hypothetical protein